MRININLVSRGNCDSLEMSYLYLPPHLRGIPGDLKIVSASVRTKGSSDSDPVSGNGQGGDRAQAETKLEPHARIQLDYYICRNSG